MAVLGKVFPAVVILLLKDREMASGKVTDKKDKQTYFKTNPQNHRVFKRWEIEKHLYDKDVLKAHGNKEGLSLDEAAFDEFVININDQNLKDETQRIKNSAASKAISMPMCSK